MWQPIKTFESKLLLPENAFSHEKSRIFRDSVATAFCFAACALEPLRLLQLCSETQYPQFTRAGRLAATLSESSHPHSRLPLALARDVRNLQQAPGAFTCPSWMFCETCSTLLAAHPPVYKGVRPANLQARRQNLSKQ